MKIFIKALLLALLVLATKADDAIPSQCLSDFQAVVGCVAGLENQGENCLECVGNAFPEEVSTCEAGKAEYCSNFNSCSDTCGDCIDEVNDYVSCVGEDFLGSSCTLDCSAAPAGPDGTGGTGSNGSTDSATPVGHLVMPLFSVVGAMVTLSFI